MAMHREFADWYRTASVTPQPELLEHRWAAVEEAASDLDGATISSLLNLFAVRGQTEPKLPSAVEDIVREHDTTYSPQGRGEETRVLAGAILRQAIEAEEDTATAAALGLLSASFGSRAKKLPAPQHLQAAERYVASKADTIRNSSVPSTVSKARILTKERFDAIVPPNLFQPHATPAARDALFAALIEATSGTASAIEPVWRAIQVAREELDLLWWLQSKFSRDLKTPFGEIPASGAAAIFAVEVADLTTLVPGPDAILGILISSLNATGDRARVATLATVVNSTPRSWRAQRSESFGVGSLRGLCPILFAITKSLDTDGESDWFPVYRKQCDVQLDDETPVSDIAMQVYRERMFARAIAEV